MRTLTLDCETRIDEPQDGIIAEPYERLDGSVAWQPKLKFAPLAVHKPQIICWLIHDKGKLEMKSRNCGQAMENEREILRELSLDLKHAQKLVTWNGRGFDMPLLSLRALGADVDWSFWGSRRDRYERRGFLFHYDLMDQMADYGFVRGLGLDNVAKVLGFGKQGMVSGIECNAYLQRGEVQPVIDYCINDVFITWMVNVRYCKTHLGKDSGRTWEESFEWAKSHETLKQFYGEGQ